MSKTTPKLGLFEYDPSTDGAQTFNIEKALNENWEKLDGLTPEQLGAAPSTHAAQHATGGSDPITPESIGAAPDGYGLGSTAMLLTDADDLNTIGRAGWYYWLANMPQNTEGLTYCTMRVDCGIDATNYATQTLYNIGGETGELRRRNCINGVWYPWEYVNPPMVLGVEYRTTERYQGTPVYVKAVNFGALPNNGRKQVSYSETVCNTISISGNAVVTGNNFPIPSTAINIVKVFVNSTTVFVETVADLSAATATFIIKYTKSTG